MSQRVNYCRGVLLLYPIVLNLRHINPEYQLSPGLDTVDHVVSLNNTSWNTVSPNTTRALGILFDITF